MKGEKQPAKGSLKLSSTILAVEYIACCLTFNSNNNNNINNNNYIYTTSPIKIRVQANDVRRGKDPSCQSQNELERKNSQDIVPHRIGGDMRVISSYCALFIIPISVDLRDV